MKLLSLAAKSLPAIALAISAFAASAQDNYPNKPLRIVVPYTPGASTDSISGNDR